jgi:hypothetical protein
MRGCGLLITWRVIDANTRIDESSVNRQGDPIMHDPAVTLSPAPCERMQNAIDTASGAIAGFALLAGGRPFTFIALLAWRDPVLGGAGLMLLALAGWLRWCWRARAAAGRGAGVGPDAKTGREASRTIDPSVSWRGKAPCRPPHHESRHRPQSR